MRITLNFDSLSSGKRGGKKHRSARAQFYSVLMRNLGGTTGDELGAAFTSGDKQKFLSMMETLSKRMADVEQTS